MELWNRIWIHPFWNHLSFMPILYKPLINIMCYHWPQAFLLKGMTWLENVWFKQSFKEQFGGFYEILRDRLAKCIVFSNRSEEKFSCNRILKVIDTSHFSFGLSIQESVGGANVCLWKYSKALNIWFPSNDRKTYILSVFKHFLFQILCSIVITSLPPISSSVQSTGFNQPCTEALQFQ